MKLEEIIEQKLLEAKKPVDVVSKALALPEPNGVKEYSEEKVNDFLDLLNYASSVQKKAVIKSDDDEHQVNIYDDIEDKVRKWNEYFEENFGAAKKEEPKEADGDEDGEKKKEESPEKADKPIKED